MEKFSWKISIVFYYLSKKAPITDSIQIEEEKFKLDIFDEAEFEKVNKIDTISKEKCKMLRNNKVSLYFYPFFRIRHTDLLLVLHVSIYEIGRPICLRYNIERISLGI